MTFPFEMVPFLGDLRYFSQGVGHCVKGDSEVTICRNRSFSTLNSHPPKNERLSISKMREQPYFCIFLCGETTQLCRSLVVPFTPPRSPVTWPPCACQDGRKVQQNGWLQLHPKLLRWWGWPHQGSVMEVEAWLVGWLVTPWKINMEPTNHPFRKENDLPNLHDYVPC